MARSTHTNRSKQRIRPRENALEVAIGAHAHDILMAEYAGKTVDLAEMKRIRARAEQELGVQRQTAQQAIARVHLAAMAV